MNTMSVTRSLADPTEPTYEGDVYDPVFTAQSSATAQPDQLEVEFGYGPLGANPAYGAIYSWGEAVFVSRTGFNNNDFRYTGHPYAPGMGPALAPGAASSTYGVAMRVRAVGSMNAWTYCDANNVPPEAPFDIKSLAELTIVP